MTKALVHKKQAVYGEARALYELALTQAEAFYGASQPEVAHLLCLAADIDRKTGALGVAEAYVLRRSWCTVVRHSLTQLQTRCTVPIARRSASSKPRLASTIHRRSHSCAAWDSCTRSKASTPRLNKCTARLSRPLPALSASPIPRTASCSPISPTLIARYVEGGMPRPSGPNSHTECAVVQRGNLVAAESAYKKALEILERTLGPLHADVSDPLNRYERERVRVRARPSVSRH